MMRDDGGAFLHVLCGAAFYARQPERSVERGGTKIKPREGTTLAKDAHVCRRG